MTGNFARGTGCCGHDERRLAACTRGSSAAGTRARALRPAAAGSGRAAACCAGNRAPQRARSRDERERCRRVMREAFQQSEKASQRAVSRILSPRLAAPCGALGAGDDHSSSPAIAGGDQATYPEALGRAVRRLAPRPPYLVLLRAGFCLPPVLPRRGALLPHLFTLTPRLDAAYAGSSTAAGGIFSVPLSFKLP